MERAFTTSWDAKLRFSTTALLAVLAAVALSMVVAGVRDDDASARLALAATLAFYLAIVGVVVWSSARYMPRRYRLANDHLVIERGMQSKRIALNAINSVERLSAGDMRGTWRTAGIGGLFCWHGWFNNRKLGDFYMSATRSDRLVLIKTDKDRIVLTPDQPDEFVAALAELSSATRS